MRKAKHFLRPLQFIDKAQRKIVQSAMKKYNQGGTLINIPVGAGKTRIALAIAMLRATRRAYVDQARTHSIPPGILVACVPCSIFEQWKREITLVAPTAPILMYHRQKQTAEQLMEFANTTGFRVFLTTIDTLYALKQSEHDEIKKMVFFKIVRPCSSFIMDEAHCKMRKSDNKMNIFARTLTVSKLGLSATPIINRRSELPPLLAALDPIYNREFQNNISTHLTLSSDEAKTLMGKFFVTADKATLGIVPTEITTNCVYFAFTKVEEEVYLQALRRLQQTCAALQSTGDPLLRQQHLLTFMGALTELRLANICPGHSRTNPSARLDSIKQFLIRQKNQGPTLVFSDFPSVFEHFKDISNLVITGDCTRKERETAIATFKSGKQNLLFLSLKAGGIGLDLANANNVVFLNRPMSPAEIEQAIGRADRRTRYGRPIQVSFIRTAGDTGVTEFTTHESKKQLLTAETKTQEQSLSGFCTTVSQYHAIQELVKAKPGQSVYAIEKTFFEKKSTK